jgi:4-alpha-glucanotransferase
MNSDAPTRQSGVLLHLSSLPSAYGIGGLGKEARDFADYLKKHGHTFWQILPLNYPGYGDSPYNPVSSFAGNPYLIDPEKLLEKGLIDRQELDAAHLPGHVKIDFPRLMKAKQKLFRTAYHNFRNAGETAALTGFMESESSWLKPFALFCLLKEHYKGKSWQKWSPQHRFYSETLFDEFYSASSDDVLYHVFLQYEFSSQLAELKCYINEQGIRIIGDLPLYVSLDSSDVWSRPDLFELADNGYPLRVAGVPPDAFSESGQLWGNPLYRWDRMQEENFDWWRRRLEKSFVFADKLRIDHFIGLVNYWAVDAGEKTAMNGSWIAGPKHAFFDAMLQHFPRESFIAEDLGILTDEVNNLREHYGFPGMIILQFCFEDGHNDILSFPENKIIYTGTHDNRTTAGWYLSNRKHKKPDNQHLESYLRRIGFLPETEKLSRDNVSEMMIKLAKASPCSISIVPMQDILALDDRARMNIPGKALGNWRWRLR